MDKLDRLKAAAEELKQALEPFGEEIKVTVYRPSQLFDEPARWHVDVDLLDRKAIYP